MIRFSHPRLLLVVAALLTLPLVSAVSAADADPTKALKNYVDKPDPAFAWKERSKQEVNGVEVIELIMTSQIWRDITWKHQLYLLKPKEITPGAHGLLLVSGGDWKAELEADPKPDGKSLPGEVSVLAGVVRQLKAPVAILSHVPFQPIFEGKVEDQIIAYTFDQYLKTQDPEWPLLLPMVKSAVRAMDTIQQYAKEKWSVDVAEFTVAGASKRGWTTWLTGAVEPRATALVPMVIDTLNMSEQMKHQLETWGKYSEQIEDYTNRGIQGAGQTPAGKALDAIVDPYHYLPELAEPKLLIMGTNDRYWVLDALNIYWNDLPGEKRILYVPNAGHDLGNGLNRVLGSISAFHRHVSGQLKMPNLTWDLNESGDKLTITVKSDIKPKQVVAWVARSEEDKDFRDEKWESFPMESKDGGYTYELPVPAAGFAAMFGEAVYDGGGLPYYLSTNMRVVGAPAAEAAAAK